MKQAELKNILRNYKAGNVSEDDVLLDLMKDATDDLGYAVIDNQRELRTGAAEVIYGEGKTPEQIVGIVSAMKEKSGRTILITRLSEESANLLADSCGELDYDKMSKTGIIGELPHKDTDGVIAVVTAGTSDMPVAEEAARAAEVFGNKVVRIYDVGVAGIHRLFKKMDALRKARAVICVAGMDGALASVVGGLVSAPVIAVPTSVGYGASFGGLAALLSMLNSCSGGVSVVNIDNGFGAACQASKINHLCLD